MTPRSFPSADRSHVVRSAEELAPIGGSLPADIVLVSTTFLNERPVS
jgi:hypothetical protein